MGSEQWGDGRGRLDGEGPAAKRRWEPMRLTYVANVSEIVLGGGGKVSLPPGDPGEPSSGPPGFLKREGCGRR